MKKELDNYVDTFKNLDLETQREELIKLVKEMIGVFQKISKDFKFNTDFIVNHELLDLNKASCSEKDFLEGMLVYLLNLGEISASSIELISDNLYQ